MRSRTGGSRLQNPAAPGRPSRRRRWLWITGVASALLFVALALIDRKIQDTGGPGIVPFELAGSSDRAREILADWGDDGRDWARVSLWLDFPYLVLYAAFFALAIAAVRDAARIRGWDRLATHGRWTVFAPIAAAALDVVEDVNLLLVVGGHAESAAPAIATGFALAKFGALAVTWVYLIVGLVALTRDQRRAPDERTAEPG